MGIYNRNIKTVKKFEVFSSKIDKIQVLFDVRSTIAEQMGRKIKNVSADTSFLELGADSLDTVKIILALEQRFDIKFDEKGAEEIKTASKAATIITKILSLK